VKFFYPPSKVLDPAGHADFEWYLERTGYVHRTTGELMFGY
jgi:hypothetical protein